MEYLIQTNCDLWQTLSMCDFFPNVPLALLWWCKGAVTPVLQGAAQPPALPLLSRLFFSSCSLCVQFVMLREFILLDLRWKKETMSVYEPVTTSYCFLWSLFTCACLCVCVRLSTWVLWAAQPCNTCGRSWPQSAVHIYILILVWSAGRVNFSLQPTEWACVLAAADFWMLAVRYWTWIWHTATALPLVLFRRCLWEKLKSLLMLSFKMKMGGGSLLLQHINKEQWMKNMLLCDVFLESVSSLYRFISVFFSRTCWTSRKAGWWNLTSKARYHFY